MEGSAPQPQNTDPLPNVAPQPASSNPGDENTAVEGTTHHGTVSFDTMAPLADAGLYAAPPAIRDMLVPGMDAGSLQNMLERPTKIFSTTWSAGTLAEARIDPWALFLNDPLVSSVVYRYKALRGDLAIKIQINGTPFHYGLLIAAYQPAFQRSQTYQSGASYSKFQLTTMPHVLINPSTSNVGTITGPMITPYNYVDLTADYPSCGVLHLASLVDLASASSTVDSITINVYVHMVEPKLSLPIVRNTPRTYLQQMGKRAKNGGQNGGKKTHEKAEATTEGFISGPLKIASRWAGYLTDVPVIGPYATATSSFAGHAADFAKFFGYSRPRDLAAPSKVLKSIGGNFANADGVDSSVSLAVNEAQELSIDPRIMGVANGVDELALSEIAGKWGLVNETLWTVGSSPNTVLYSADVDPKFGVVDPLPGAQYDIFTPLYFAAVPFKYWSGTIEVKVQVVCSKFHRGRLRVQWAPNGVFDDDSSINTSFSQIIEISDQVDHIFQIPFASETGYLSVKQPGITPGRSFSNGTLRVVVQNELNSPEAITPAHVLLWVRGGSDFKVAYPGALNRLSPYNPQMGDVGIADADVSEQVHAFFDITTFDQFNDVFMADPVISFRPLLKRFAHSVSVNLESLTIPASSAVTMSLELPRYPLNPGLVEYASGWADVTGSFTRNGTNVNSNTLFNHLGIAFLAKRGSYRWKINTYKSRDDIALDMYASLNRATVLNLNETEVSYGNQQQARIDAGMLGWGEGAGSTSGEGVAYSHGDTRGNKMLEFEVPFYEQGKFVTQPQELLILPTGYYPENGFKIQLLARNRTGAGIDPRGVGVRCYCAAGEDFTMGAWRGIVPPWLYVPITDPDSVSVTAA